MDKLKIIAFTHQNTGLSEIGLLHLEEERRKAILTQLKNELNLEELMYLSTCNRVEFYLVNDQDVDHTFLLKFFNIFASNWSETQTQSFAKKAIVHAGMNAVKHTLEVASSIDSMVIGEREIITQVRKAYAECNTFGLTKDFLRLLNKKTIETAKKVYTQTQIACKPVSVVSLAYHLLKDKNVRNDARILIVGAGITNTNMSKFLKKHGFSNFHVYNRTLANAEKLANQINGVAKPLIELINHDKGFDVLVTCTGAQTHIIDENIYAKLNQGDTHKKYVIDIAIPCDLDPSLADKYNIDHISVEKLKVVADANLAERAKEIIKVNSIIEEELISFESWLSIRQVELKMSEVPKQIKEIKSTAVNHVFAEELSELDENSKEVLDKILAYVEKKYVSVPMKMAKEILLDQNQRN